MYTSAGTTRKGKIPPLYMVTVPLVDVLPQQPSIIDAFPVPSWESDDSGQFIQSTAHGKYSLGWNPVS